MTLMRLENVSLPKYNNKPFVINKKNVCVIVFDGKITEIRNLANNQIKYQSIK